MSKGILKTQMQSGIKKERREFNTPFSILTVRYTFEEH